MGGGRSSSAPTVVRRRMILSEGMGLMASSRQNDARRRPSAAAEKRPLPSPKRPAAAVAEPPYFPLKRPRTTRGKPHPNLAVLRYLPAISYVKQEHPSPSPSPSPSSPPFVPSRPAVKIEPPDEQSTAPLFFPLKLEEEELEEEELYNNTTSEDASLHQVPTFFPMEYLLTSCNPKCEDFRESFMCCNNVFSTASPSSPLSCSPPCMSEDFSSDDVASIAVLNNSSSINNSSSSACNDQDFDEDAADGGSCDVVDSLLSCAGIFDSAMAIFSSHQWSDQQQQQQQWPTLPVPKIEHCVEQSDQDVVSSDNTSTTTTETTTNSSSSSDAGQELVSSDIDEYRIDLTDFEPAEQDLLHEQQQLPTDDHQYSLYCESGNHPHIRHCGGHHRGHPQQPRLSLNYDDVLTAWSDRGSVLADGSWDRTSLHDCQLDLAAWEPADGSLSLPLEGIPEAGKMIVLPLQELDEGNINNAMEDGSYNYGAAKDSSCCFSGGRQARVMRYREKRRTRLFSKKIRYEVRKLNAERRPRMKGRFIKRTSE